KTQVRPQHLDRYAALEAQVLGAIHLGEATRTDPGTQFISGAECPLQPRPEFHGGHATSRHRHPLAGSHVETWRRGSATDVAEGRHARKRSVATRTGAIGCTHQTSMGYP